MEVLNIIGVILNKEFHMFGIDFKFLYLVIMAILFKLFFIIYGKGNS